jgi:predicted MPP superfamily phosphohydrolase
MAASDSGGGANAASLTFAHLSDIHFAGYAPGAVFDLDSDQRRELVYDLENVVEKSGPLDALLIGGDIAGTGQEHEYKTAADWIAELCAKFDVQIERVYCVPGNHDVDWNVINGDPVIRTLQEDLLACRVDQFNSRLERLVSQGPHRALLLSGLDAYNEFAARYGCSFDLTEHRWEQVLPLGDLRLQIFGLASAIVAGPSDVQEPEHSLLALGPQGVIGRFKDTFTIVLCHHPPAWLRDRASVERYLQRGHLQLYGHDHSFNVARSGAGVRVDAGAVHPARSEAKWEPSYNVIKLAVDEASKSVVNLDIYPRRLKEDGKFGPVDAVEVMQRHSVSTAFEAEEGETVITDEEAESVQEAPELTSVDERKVAQLFVSLSPERRLELGRELGLVQADDEALPEGARLRRIFEAARDQDKLFALRERIENG